MKCPICKEGELYWCKRVILVHSIDNIDGNDITLNGVHETIDDDPLVFEFYCDKCGELDSETVHRALEKKGQLLPAKNR